MADYTPDHRGMGRYLRTCRELQEACMAVAEREARELAARTPVEEGETRASTRAERARFGDRVGAYVVQEYAAVTLQWGNDRTRARHHMTERH